MEIQICGADTTGRMAQLSHSVCTPGKQKEVCQKAFSALRRGAALSTTLFALPKARGQGGPLAGSRRSPWPSRPTAPDHGSCGNKCEQSPLPSQQPRITRSKGMASPLHANQVEGPRQSSVAVYEMSAGCPRLHGTAVPAASSWPAWLSGPPIYPRGRIGFSLSALTSVEVKAPWFARPAVACAAASPAVAADIETTPGGSCRPFTVPP
jgi:hypothetical protein